jgi:hypothetical protein
MVNAGDSPLCGNVELPNRLDLVAEELYSNGRVEARCEQVNQAAPEGEIADLFDNRHAFESEPHQTPDNIVKLILTANLKVNLILSEVLSRDGWFDQGSRGTDHDFDSAVHQPGQG